MDFAAKSLAISFLVIALSTVAGEIVILGLKKRPYYETKDALCNLGIMIIGRLSQPLFAAYILVVLTQIARFTPVHLPQSLGTTLAALLVTDFVYYWEHRLSHSNRWLWFFHEVHHSSRYFNLMTSFRLSWLGRITAPLVFGPLVLLGFDPKQVVLFFVINLFYQFFLHTQLVGQLPFIEGIFNTPSAHRVHHARNKEYLNKNFGGILMIWDRLFGTYEPEVAAPRFGIIGRFESTNPFTVQFHKVWFYSKVASASSALVRKLSGRNDTPPTKVTSSA